MSSLSKRLLPVNQTITSNYGLLRIIKCQININPWSIRRVVVFNIKLLRQNCPRINSQNQKNLLKIKTEIEKNMSYLLLLASLMAYTVTCIQGNGNPTRHVEV